MQTIEAEIIPTEGWYCSMRRKTINFDYIDSIIMGESKTILKSVLITGFYESTHTGQKYKITREKGVYYQETFNDDGSHRDKYQTTEEDLFKRLGFDTIRLTEEVLSASPEDFRISKEKRTHTVTKKVDKDQLNLF